MISFFDLSLTPNDLWNTSKYDFDDLLSTEHSGQLLQDLGITPKTWRSFEWFHFLISLWCQMTFDIFQKYKSDDQSSTEYWPTLIRFGYNAKELRDFEWFHVLTSLTPSDLSLTSTVQISWPVINWTRWTTLIRLGYNPSELRTFTAFHWLTFLWPQMTFDLLWKYNSDDLSSAKHSG